MKDLIFLMIICLFEGFMIGVLVFDRAPHNHLNGSCYIGNIKTIYEDGDMSHFKRYECVPSWRLAE